jgi:hypothetical protein
VAANRDPIVGMETVLRAEMQAHRAARMGSPTLSTLLDERLDARRSELPGLDLALSRWHGG